MALNDIVLVDGIIDEIMTSKSIERNNKTISKEFELFAIAELLKTYDLAEEQIKDGIVDGGDDGGIDGIYIFVNGNYLSSVSSYNNWPKQNGTLEIYVITCKCHSTYEIKPLESMDTSLSELLNFSITENALSRQYNSTVITKRNLFIAAYKKLALQNIEPIINLYYISRGDSNEVATNIRRTGDKLISTCNVLFQQGKVSMTFWGAKELISQFRAKRNSAIEIKAQRVLQYESDFVILVSLKDYFNFIIDSNGKLKRYLFDSNVRDYLAENSTNADIEETLKNNSSPDFWLLNNGITILASNITPFDKTLTIEDVQIVNGLQTTVTLYNFLTTENCYHVNDALLNKNILIKVIKSNDIEIRNQIVRATNNQSAMPLYALHANNKIQRDIEDILLRFGFGYERRPNYYINLGYPENKTVTPLYIAGGYINLILKRPHTAIIIKTKFMNNPIAYDRVFSEKENINVWPVIAYVLKRTDSITEQYRTIVKLGTKEKRSRIMRHIVSLVSLARLFGRLSFSTNDLVSMDISLYTEDIIRETTENFVSYINSYDAIQKSVLRKKGFVKDYLLRASEQYMLPDYDSVSSRPDIYMANKAMKNASESTGVIGDSYHSESFLASVRANLPLQPWPYGIHKDVAKKLQCSNSKVYKAISVLIKMEVYAPDTFFQ